MDRAEWRGSGAFRNDRSFGTGCATEDYDLDGHLDLFFFAGGDASARQGAVAGSAGLFRRTGAWRYASVAPARGLVSIRHYQHGTWTADFDEDGFADLL